MTLNLEKFIANSIATQAKIQHLVVKTKTVKNVPESVASIIVKEYGDSYLQDADYVSFFWGAIGKDEIKKLFNVVDKALGKSANKLTETDFKKINELSGKEVETEDIEDVEVDAEEPEDDEEEEVEVEEPEEDGSNDDNDENEKLDEDEEVDVEVEEKPAIENYFFLKITLK